MSARQGPIVTRAAAYSIHRTCRRSIRNPRKTIAFLFVIAFSLVLYGLVSCSSVPSMQPTAARPKTADQLEKSFTQPADDARIMVRWWWYGPAVTKPELEKEMKTMKDGGI